LDIWTRRLGKGEFQEIYGLRIGGGDLWSGPPRRFWWRSERRYRQDWQFFCGGTKISRRPRKSICNYIV
jgi:hypothetical protein